MSTPPPARQLRSWSRHALALGLFVVAFSTLEIISYSRESATWDEPVHLLDGYRSLSGDFRVDVEHPPLLRMWAALPLLLTDLRWDRRLIDDASPFGWAIDGVFKAAHQFLYVDNDADRLLYRSRFMIVLLGLMLGVLLYAWAQALYGWSAAATVLAIYTAEPNIASHARLVTTDFGVTLAIFGAVFFAWRTAVRWTIVNASGIVAFSAMAVLSKFSGLLLAPMLLLLLTVAVIRRRLTLRRAAAVSAATTIVALAAIWACYGFRYLPSDDPRWRYAFHTEPFAKHDLPVTTAVVRWIDGHRLLPNAYTEGFLLTQARAQRRKAYLSGEYSETGWWYYFPYALAVKTPLALLVLAALGLWIVATRGDPNGWYLWVPCVVVMGVAMSATINLGVRHILPIFPFMVMLAGAAVERLRPRRVAVAAVLVMLAIAEPARAYIHTRWRSSTCSSAARIMVPSIWSIRISTGDRI